MKVVALAGGVGGAKLVDGLSRLDPALELTVIVNTGDDFSLFGLEISPDLDTICYNLADLAGSKTVWGRKEESWVTMEELKLLEAPDWFQLGGKDLATHLERTRRLQNGEALSVITADFCDAWGVQAVVLPMSDDPVPTLVESNLGTLSFQDYFVRMKCEPEVQGFIFKNASHSKPAPGVLKAIQGADLVVVCPSNPWVSIDPILAVPGIRSALESKTVLGVSPLIGNMAVKGPAAKMCREMGVAPSAAAVAAHYGSLLDGFVIDDQDLELKEDIIDLFQGSITVFVTDIWMRVKKDRIVVADKVLEFGNQLVKEV